MPEHDETSPHYQHGMEELRKHLGPMADSYIQTIKEVSPEFAWVNVEFPYGDPREVIADANATYIGTPINDQSLAPGVPPSWPDAFRRLAKPSTKLGLK